MTRPPSLKQDICLGTPGQLSRTIDVRAGGGRSENQINIQVFFTKNKKIFEILYCLLVHKQTWKSADSDNVQSAMPSSLFLCPPSKLSGMQHSWKLSRVNKNISEINCWQCCKPRELRFEYGDFYKSYWQSKDWMSLRP